MTLAPGLVPAWPLAHGAALVTAPLPSLQRWAERTRRGTAVRSRAFATPCRRLATQAPRWPEHTHSLRKRRALRAWRGGSAGVHPELVRLPGQLPYNYDAFVVDIGRWPIAL
jgi:hypothetical protein